MDFMNKTKTLLLIVSISSLLLLSNAVPSTRPLHIVHHDIRSDLLKFCQNTTNSTLCALTIQPHILHGDLDPFKALEIQVEATLNETKKTASIIDEFLAKSNTAKALKDSLKICKGQYSNILDSIKETKDAIAKHDLIEAKFKFSAVISYQSTCKDEFEESECPFAADSDTIFQLGGNALDIIAEMEKTVAPKQQEPPVQSTPSQFSSVIGTIS